MLTSLLTLIDTEEKVRFEELYHEYEQLLFYIAKNDLEIIALQRMQCMKPLSVSSVTLMKSMKYAVPGQNII